MTAIGLDDLMRLVTQRRPGLIEGLPTSAPAITSITQDSRTVEQGSLFCAIRGASDGHEYVSAAVERGAAAVLVDHLTGAAVPEVVVSDTREATGYVASAFWGNPSESLRLVGVTGTNGKTSIVSMIEHLVSFCGDASASMGTLTGSLTTSAAPEFQEALARHRDDGCAVVAAEVSSHALDQKRIAGSRVSVAVFSNLSQDHLDYHQDMDDYFAAKARLFDPELSESAVVDVSDEWGRRLARHTTIETIEVDGGAIAAAAQLGQRTSTFVWRERTITLPLGGRFSVHNALLAAETCLLLGYDPTTIAKGLESTPPIPGRFESIDAGQPFAVVVDYSHTPASIEAAVSSARALTSGRVLLVFGAAGDRDPGKRPLMGQAARHADLLYVTSDNPRTEDPDMIIDQVVAGTVDAVGEVVRIADRREAIRSAISDAQDGDIVVIAGKGHEDYQIVGTTRRDFDDRLEARRALADRGWGSAA